MSYAKALYGFANTTNMSNMNTKFNHLLEQVLLCLIPFISFGSTVTV